MNILFLCHRYPYPPNRGGKIRPFQMIRHLSQNHSVVVASLAHTEQELLEGSDLAKHCELAIGAVLPDRTRWSQAVQALATSEPSSLAYFRSKQLQRKVSETWAKRKFDAIWVHCAFAAQYALTLQGPARRILDFGDIDSGKWQEYSEIRRFPLTLGYALEARKLRAFEIAAAKKFDRITVTAPGERETFEGMNPGMPCTVIPNGVDTDYFHSKLSIRTSRVLVFLGRMDYFPNIQGISQFAKTIFPLIRRDVPDVTLQIVGANPTNEVRSLGNIPGVSVTGFVKDVRPFLDGAAVALAPLLIARGTQNKILECMACGVPVVSTPQAAKGVQATPGEHLLVGEGADAFAQAVLDLLKHPERGLALSTAARAQVERVHSWPMSMKILDKVLAFD
jgi:polysaccharide biosynthesis protein PslH